MNLFRGESKDIIYVDETWVKVGRRPHDGAETSDSTWPEICDCSCRWKKWIINHAKFVFLAKKNSAD
jgi:hypothetical protein